MLRLRPTVISLASTEVTELAHRRQFRRFLESERRANLGITQAESDDGIDASLCEPFSLLRINPEAAPERHHLDRDSPPPPSSETLPLVVDLPALLPANLEVEEGRMGAGDEEELDWDGEVRLGMRPRRNSLPAGIDFDEIIDLDCSVGWHGPPQNTPVTPDNRGSLERTPAAAFVTPPQARSPSSGSRPPPLSMPSRWVRQPSAALVGGSQ